MSANSLIARYSSLSTLLSSSEVEAEARACGRFVDDAGFEVAGRNKVLAFDGLPVAFADELAAFDIVPAGGSDDDLPATGFVVGRFDADALADGVASAVTIAVLNAASFVAGRHPHALFDVLHDRVMPDAITDRTVFGLHPDAI